MSAIICNPLNLEYRYQLKKAFGREAVFREAADPTMLVFKNRYYLFASMSGGFWHSDDLASWEFHETPEVPIYDYAPDVREVNGKVIFSASKRGEPCSLFESEDPLSVPFKAVSTPFEFWDPDVFQDDDGRVYLYWGCTNTDPLYGVELDRETLMPLGEKVVLFGEAEAEHGWERSGENNKLSVPKTKMEKLIRQHLGTKPFIEGAFMTKHGGRYYMQYASPGTEHNVYSDGVYTSESPLGPFTYQAHNPFSSKPGGFITGAGHGSTFKDKHGDWWHISTMRISVNENFERRLGLFPCYFDDDGILYCDQNFADYPFYVSREKAGSPIMSLLSYGKTATASSHRPGAAPENAVDENIRTCWSAATAGADEWLQIDLGQVYEPQVIQVNFSDFKRPMPEGLGEAKVTGYETRLILVKPQRTRYLLEGSTDGLDWAIIKDSRDAETDYTHDLIVLDGQTPTRFIRISHMETALDGIPAISGLRVFGTGLKSRPDAVKEVEASRSQDRLNILLKWPAVSGADGYNVRYGLAPDKLYSSWQLFRQHELDLGMINKRSSYYLAVDSFNESGVTAGEIVFVQ